MGFKREFSSGGVVYKKRQAFTQKGGQASVKCQVKFLLGKHSGYHKWVLPKGLIEKGEKSWQTAIRETEEEMGVKTKLVREKPIHKEEYFFVADLKQLKIQNEKIKIAIKNSKLDKNKRRVEKYQEDGGKKVRVFKTVTFYLLEYVSGRPEEHGWEMEEAGWFEYEEALKLMAFKGEKEALKKAKRILDSGELQLIGLNVAKHTI